jgi:hypothetical protein
VFVIFAAKTRGQTADSIVISAGGANGKVVTVPVVATVLGPPTLMINPSTPQVFAASVGQSSSPVTFGVVNAGDIATGTITAEITGANATDFVITDITCATLAPLATCTISVVFKPAAIPATSPSATLTVTDPTSSSSVSVALSCCAGGPNRLVISPASADLGTAVVGTTGPATTFTLTNTGDSATGTLSVSVSTTEFVVTSDTCTGVSLAALTGSCTVSVALAPTTIGTKTATLKVEHTMGITGLKTLTGLGTVAVDAGPALDAGMALDSR